MSITMAITIATVSLSAQKQEGGLTLYLSPPTKKQQNILVLADLHECKEHYKKILKLLINETENNFPHSETDTLEKALEDALQEVNFSISEIIKQTKKDWLTASHILIAAVNTISREVSFAKIGKVAAYLASQNDIVSITEESTEGEINPIKPFANIYSGTLPKDASMLFLTEKMLDYVSLEKIRKLSAEHSAKNTADELEQLLNKARQNTSFGAFIIKEEQEREKPPHNNAKTEPQQHRHKEEKETLPEALSKPIKQKKIPTETTQPTEEKHEIRDYTSRKQFSLSFSEKIIGAALILIFFALIVFNIMPRGKQAPSPSVSEETPVSPTAPAYEQTILAITNKLGEAQDQLIRKEKLAAQTLLSEIQETVTQLPEETVEQKQQKERLAKKIATQLLVAQGVNLATASVLTQFTEFVPPALVFKENSLYFFNPANSAFYQIETTKGGILTPIEITIDKVGAPQSVIDHTGEGIVFYHSLDGLMQLNLEKKILAPLSWERTWKGKPIAADIYQNNLYVISGENKIFKYSRSFTGFTREALWLQKDVSPELITGAVSMAIDGNVWILKESGAILKLFKGKQEPFTYSLTPPLKNPTHIVTDLGFAYLYVLDPGTQRIVLLNKEGVIVNQLTSEQFSSPNDLSVDEKNRKMYVLDGSRVLEVPF